MKEVATRNSKGSGQPQKGVEGVGEEDEGEEMKK